MNSHFQRTLRNTISCSGKGLHSGVRVQLTLQPAPVDTGIVFQRTDVTEAKSLVPARYDNVSEATLGTTITNEHGIKVATIEHLMAALCGCGVDNALIALDGPEIPIMDGSAEPFVFLIECAGLIDQDALRRYIRVKKPVRIEQGNGFAEVSPAENFAIDLEIDFNNPVVARQSGRFDFNDTSFKNTICRARTFGFAEEVINLQAMGFARGGSLDNAIVVDKDRVLNEDGLRYDDEFVRHKVLDCIGDIYLAGHYLLGHVHGYRSGHKLNNMLLRALFADKAAWEYTTREASQKPVIAAAPKRKAAKQPAMLATA